MKTCWQLGALVLCLALRAGRAAAVEAATPGGAAALPPITLNLKDASVEKVAEALTKATGVGFVGNSPGVARGRDNGGGQGPFSLEVKDQTLWEVYMLLSRQGSLDLMPTAPALAQQGIALTQPPQARRIVVAEPPNGPAIAVAYEQAAGPVLIRAGTAPVTMRGGPVGANAPAGDPMHPVITVAAVADPRLMAAPVALKISEMMDENGKKLEVQKVQKVDLGMSANAMGGAVSPRPRDYDRMNYWAWQVTLALPEGHGKTIASAKGQVVMVVATEKAEVALDNATEKHANEVTKVGDHTFTLASLTPTKMGPPQSERMGLTMAFTMDDIAQKATVPSPKVVVIDADGKVALDERAWISGWQTVGKIAGGDYRLPLKVVVTVAKKTEEVAVPFEVKWWALP